MVVLDYQPLTVGERAGMRLFVNCAVPGYVPPCYATVKDSLLPAALKDVEYKLESALRDNYNFTVATDIWTFAILSLHSLVPTLMTNLKEKPPCLDVSICPVITMVTIFVRNMMHALQNGKSVTESCA